MKHLLYAVLKVASAIGGLLSIGIIVAVFVAFLILPQMPKLEDSADFELQVPFSVYTQEGMPMRSLFIHLWKNFNLALIAL